MLLPLTQCSGDAPCLSPAQLTALQLDRVTPLSVVVREVGSTPQQLPLLLSLLRHAGMTIITVEAPLTARSTTKVVVDLVVRDAQTAALRLEKKLQLAGLAIARRLYEIPPSPIYWYVRAHLTHHTAVDGQFIPGPCPDALWVQYGRDGWQQTVQVEYTMGGDSGTKLDDKLRRYGRSPQLWLTPSAQHAGTVRAAMQRVWPGVAGMTVRVVGWTGLDQGQ